MAPGCGWSWHQQGPCRTRRNSYGEHMPDQPSPVKQMIGDYAPKLVELTDDVLFGDVWERPGLSKRDRSLVTVVRPRRPQPHRTAPGPPPPCDRQRCHRGRADRGDHPPRVLLRLADGDERDHVGEEALRVRYDAVACTREQNELGEGARWDARRNELLRVDIIAGRVYRDTLTTTAASFPLPSTWCRAPSVRSPRSRATTAGCSLQVVASCTSPPTVRLRRSQTTSLRSARA